MSGRTTRYRALAPKTGAPDTLVVPMGPPPTTTSNSAVDVEAVEVEVQDGALDAACPHCGGPLKDHGTDVGPKAGAHHCDACGGCWVRRDGVWDSRAGHDPPLGWTGGAP